MTTRSLTTSRSGLSWVEVLIIFVMLALLAGLVLTAIVRLRQSAAQIQCGNNLRQLGIGVSGYSDSMGRLPPLVDQGEGSPTGRGLPSVFTHLGPFLEATPWRYVPGHSPDEKYHAPSSTVFSFTAKGTPIDQEGGYANQRWRMFDCPADTTADKLRDVPVALPGGSTGHYATGSYAANGMAPWGGKFQWGASGLIVFAERPQVCRTAGGETVHNLWGVGFYSPQMPAFATLTPDKPAGLWSTGQIAPVLLSDADGHVWVRVGRADAELMPSDLATPVQRIRPDRPCDPRLPGAMHPDGMHALMGDGSVRVFRYDTTPWAFWAACVPAKR